MLRPARAKRLRPGIDGMGRSPAEGSDPGLARWLAATAAAFACMLAGWACDSDETSEPAPPEPAPAFRHHDFYESLRQHAEHFTRIDGDWVEDYGDAAFYGLAFYAQAGVQEGHADWRARADEAATRAVTIIDNADLLNDDINETAMSALGLVEYFDATGDRTQEPKLGEIIDRIDALVAAVGWYLDTDAVDSFAIDTYGPTSVSGLIGLLNLQHAYVLGTLRSPTYVEWAQQMQDQIDARAWTGSYYAFGRGRDGLFLYPNVTMILHSARLYQLTGDERYRERALAVFDAIEPLRVESPDGSVRYRSPYSAEVMGAQTDDYTTLSSQNYLMFALQLLYQVSGKARFVEDTDAVLDSLQNLLVGPWCLSDWHRSPCTPACDGTDVCVVDACRADGCHDGVLHHWMDGGPAVPTDPEFFCSGCNLQLLYIMWYRQHRL